jgi:O-acetyl-ADP-ribose deacetylase (regulator of RNase III)
MRTRLAAVRADITTLDVDAIVNALALYDAALGAAPDRGGA